MRPEDLSVTLHQFGASVLLVPLIVLSVIGLAAMLIDLLNGE